MEPNWFCSGWPVCFPTCACCGLTVGTPEPWKPGWRNTPPGRWTSCVKTRRPKASPCCPRLRRAAQGFAVLPKASPCCPRLRRAAQGFAVLPKHWIVEGTFAWLGRHSRLSKGYEARPDTSEAWIYVAMIDRMLERLTASI